MKNQRKSIIVLLLALILTGVSIIIPDTAFGCSLPPNEVKYTPVVFTKITTQTDSIRIYVYEDTTLKVKNQSGVIFQKHYKSEGTKTVRIPQQKAKAKLKFTLTTSYGTKGGTVTKTVKDDGIISNRKIVSSLKKPKVYGKITDKSVSVKVKASKGETLYIQNGSKVLKKAEYHKTGSQTLSIPRQKAGTKLTFYTTGKKKGRSVYVTKTVEDVTAPAKPNIFFAEGETDITVKGEIGTKVYVKHNSTEMKSSWTYMGTMLEKTYTFSLQNAGISSVCAGDSFSIRLVDDAGNKSASAKTGKVKEDIAWDESGR